MADEWARKRERQPVGETGLSLSLSTSPMRGESARKRYRVPLQAGFGSTRPRERTPLPARPAGERFHIFFLQARRAVSARPRAALACMLFSVDLYGTAVHSPPAAPLPSPKLRLSARATSFLVLVRSLYPASRYPPLSFHLSLYPSLSRPRPV